MSRVTEVGMEGAGEGGTSRVADRMGVGCILRAQVPPVRRSSMESDGPSSESRSTKTPLKTGTAATELLVWTSAVRAPSGAMPTSSRVGIPAGVFAGMKVLVP